MEFLHALFDPNLLEQLLREWGWIGYPILFAIIFAETGLLVGFFFPGDSLLFVAGFVSSIGALNYAVLAVLLCIAAIVGDGVGYYLGRKIGRKAFEREDSFFFRKSHLIKAHEFYEKHGGKTIIIARFVPIVRTFAPFVAGIALMTYPKFLSFNIFGGIGWVVSMTGAGYLLGNIPIVRHNFEKVVLLIIFLSVLPIAKEVLAAWLKNRRRSAI